MAGNEDEDRRRRGKEKQKDEDGGGGKKEDVGSTSGGGEVKKKGRFMIGSDSAWEDVGRLGIDPPTLGRLWKDAGWLWKDVGWGDKKLKKNASDSCLILESSEKHKGEDGSTSGGEVKKKGGFSIGSDSDWKGIGIDPSSLKDVGKFWKDVGWFSKDKKLKKIGNDSDSDANDPFSRFMKDLAKIWPGIVASTSDIPEKVDAGTRKREPRVSERNLLMPQRSSDDNAGDPSGTPTSSSENTASEVGGISLGRSSRLANLGGTPTGSSETTAKSSENSGDMAENADEDRRHGKEKQKDEYGRGGKQKDVASTSGGWRKQVGRYSVKTESYSDGNKKVMKQSGRFVEYESDSDENGRDSLNLGAMFKGLIPFNDATTTDVPEKKKDVGSTSGGGNKKLGNDPFSPKDLSKSLPGNVASTSDIPEKVDAGTRKRDPRVSERNSLMPPSSSDDYAGDPSGTPTSSLENTASEVGGISLGRSSKLANLSGTPTGSSETTAKSSENSRDMAGNADEDRRHGKEKQKDEDGCGGNQKDVASTSGGGRKQVGRYSVKTESYSDGNGAELNLRAMFKGLIPFNWPEVRDRILRMPEGSENIVGDPIRSGSQDPCEYSTSGEAPPPSSSSDSDVDETKKND